MFVALLLEGVLHLAELLLQATSLYHLHPELVVETYPSHIPTVLEGSPWIPKRKHNKKNQRLTTHVYPKPTHLIALPGHLSL